MFRITVICWSVLVLAVAAVLTWTMTRVDDADRQAANDMGERMSLQKREHHHAFRIYSQHREQLRRDLWLPQEDGTRLHAIHMSDTADLSASEHSRGLVEVMHGVRCCVQEQIDATSSQQQVSVLEAPQATYDYHLGTLDAAPARMLRYRLPGIVLPDSFRHVKPLWVGEAESAQIVIDGPLAVRARGFKGFGVPSQKRPKGAP